MTTTTESKTSPEILPYLEQLKQRLAHLPEAERAELLHDLELHLEEIVTDESGTPLPSRIGAPDIYAKEFAESIGADAPKGHRSPLRALSNGVRRLTEMPVMRWLRGIWPEMRPAMWALRGAVLSLLLTWGWLFPGPSPNVTRRVAAALLLVALVGASMRIGRNWSRSRNWRYLSHGLTVAGAIALVALTATISARTYVWYYDDYYYPGDAPYDPYTGELIYPEYFEGDSPMSTTTLPSGQEFDGR